MISVKVTPRTKQVLLNAKQCLYSHKAGIEQGLADSGMVVVAAVRALITTGNRTGRTYKIGARTHTASAPGEPPANLSGRLAKSSNYKVSGWDEMTVGETASYAVFLEKGTKKMKPRPHLIVAVNTTASHVIGLIETRVGKALKR